MRFVTGSFRIVSDLSHIDGMTRDAAFLVAEVPEKATSKVAGEFTEMASATAKMVEKAIDAFCNSDVAAAQEVIQDDAAVNLIYGDVTDKLVVQIREGKSSARYLPEVLMVAKYFERIGDLAKRIASWAIFRVTGEHVTEKGVDSDPDRRLGFQFDSAREGMGLGDAREDSTSLGRGVLRRGRQEHSRAHGLRAAPGGARCGWVR